MFTFNNNRHAVTKIGLIKRPKFFYKYTKNLRSRLPGTITGPQEHTRKRNESPKPHKTTTETSIGNNGIRANSQFLFCPSLQPEHSI